MAWSWLQSVGNSGNGITSLSATFTTANLSPGSKLICAVGSDAASAQSVSSVKDGAGNAMTSLLPGVTLPDTVGTAGLFAMDTPAGDAGAKPAITVTVGVSGSIGFLVQEVSGLLAGNTTAMLDGTPGTATGTASGSTTSPAYSSTAANEYLVLVYADAGTSTTWTAPGSPWTGDPNGVNTTSNDDAEIAYANSAGGAESGHYSLNATSSYAIILVAFRLAPPPSAAGAAVPAQPGLTWERRFRHRQALPQPAAASLVTGSTALAGAGALAALATVIAPASPAGAGTLAASVTQGSAVTATGAGTVQPPPVIQGSSVTLAGAGTAAALAVQGATAAAAGAGSVSALVTGAATVSAAGAGTVSGLAVQGANGSLAGAGTLNALVTERVTASLAGAGTVNANSGGSGSGTAALAGAGTLSAAAVQSAPVSLAGAGSLTAAATVTAAATLAGAGTFTAPAVLRAPAALSGAGTVTAAGTAQGPFTVGTLTASGAPSAALTATAASSALTAATAPQNTLTATDKRTGGPA